MKGSALEQVLREALGEAFDNALREAVERALQDVSATVVRVGEEVVVWPPPGVPPRTPAQQAEARRIAYEESLAFSQAHSGDYLRRIRHLKAAS